MHTHKFKKPYSFEGKEYKDITLNLDGLTGQDVTEVKKMMTQQGNLAAVPALDPDFCNLLAAKASKQPVEFFNALPAGEYIKIAQVVGNFLGE